MNPYNPKHSPRARRKARNRDLLKPGNVVRESAVAPSSGGKSKRLPLWKPVPFDVTGFQARAYADTAVVAHAFHADRSRKGTFGRSPLNRNPLTVRQRELQKLKPTPQD